MASISVSGRRRLDCTDKLDGSASSAWLAGRRGGLVAPLAGVLIGAAYGLLGRLVIGLERKAAEGPAAVFGAVSIAFLILVPAALGAVAVAVASRGAPASVARAICLPWLSVLCLMAGVFVTLFEGTVCIVMAAPVFLTASSVGGLSVYVAHQVRGRRAASRTAAALAVVPFLAGPLEERLPRPDVVRTVTTVTEVDAPGGVLFRHVVRVPAIRREETRFSPFHAIGIPRPLEATIDREGTGALRVARFAGGLRFEERVTEWEPPRRLAFTIGVVPASILPGVLDEHVRVGSREFDVVWGGFTIEPLGGGRSRLVLTSRHRLSTRLNPYAGLWTDAVMRDLQEGICAVIRGRAEAEARGVREGPAPPAAPAAGGS